MKRWAALALLLLAPLTLAPRTSAVLTNNWEYLAWNRSFNAKGGTSTYTATIWQATSEITKDTLVLAVFGSDPGFDWTLVAASTGCAPVDGVVECVVDLSGQRSQQVISVTVRSSDRSPAIFELGVAQGDVEVTR